MMLDELLQLARAFAAPEHDLCILAEGNVSARADEATFWVKGSGQSMGEMGSTGFSRVRFAQVLNALDYEFLSDDEIRSTLNNSRDEGPAPSTETFMHGYLLGLPGVQFVGHSHPPAVLSLLCLQDAKSWAFERLFPDEIVCCGPATCYVPYVAPGLDLARSIREEVNAFREEYGVVPKTLWLQNHGLISLGGSAKEVLAGSLMAVKAARVLLGSLQSGHPVRWLSKDEVAHIYQWPDEHARQRMLFGSS